MKKLFIIGALLFIVSCGGKAPVLTDSEIDIIQERYDIVKECMGITQETGPVTLEIVPGVDAVMCDGIEVRGCYTSSDATITMPEYSNWTTFSHEMVHHLLFETTGDSDHNHESEYFLKCAGITVHE